MVNKKFGKVLIINIKKLPAPFGTLGSQVQILLPRPKTKKGCDTAQPFFYKSKDFGMELR